MTSFFSDHENEEIDTSTLRSILNLIVDEIVEKDHPLKLSAIYISSPQSKQGQTKLYRENLKTFERSTEIPVFSGDDVIQSRKNFSTEKETVIRACVPF